MAKKSKGKMSKSSLVTRIGGIVAVLALVSTGLTNVEDILDKLKNLIDGQDPKNKCYNVELNHKEKVPYSRINDLDIFEIQADNDCSYPIMVRVEFDGNQKLQINALDSNNWPEYTIKANTKDFRTGIILPNPLFLTDERQFPVQIKWTIFEIKELGGELRIGGQTRIINIVDG